MRQTKKTLEMVQIAMLIALVVVLQLLSAVIPRIGGTVSITLTLVPVVVGAILFGKKGGIMLGLTFGIIVMANCITALDPGGNVLWSANPFFTALICIVKGVAAGLAPALVYKLVTGKSASPSAGRKYVSALLASLSAPVVNTGLFVCGMLVFFTDMLKTWAGDSDVITYILIGLVGINFVVEFLINIVLTPAITRIVDVVKNKIK